MTVAFATEEGAFLRGQVRMEDHVDLNLDPFGITRPLAEGEGDSTEKNQGSGESL